LSWLDGWDKGRRFDALAADYGATLTGAAGLLSLSLTCASAHGSSNHANPHVTGIDQEFRQTGYEDNTGMFDGVATFQYYGELFDPELANLDILTIGAGLRIRTRASIDAVYHRYRQPLYDGAALRDLEGTDLTLFDLGGRGIDPGNGRPARTFFPYRDVGNEIDIIIGLARWMDRINAKWVMAWFHPDDALFPPFWSQLPFKPKRQTAFLNQLSIELLW
jgi:hypothetical protein